jgi:hypothetical protein
MLRTRLPGRFATLGGAVAIKFELVLMHVKQGT